MIDIRYAQEHLSELIDALLPGENLLIARDERPVARLSAMTENARPQCGSCRGMLRIVENDDTHLDDFADYMP